MLERQLKHVSCPVVVLRLSDTNLHGDQMADGLRDEMLGIYLSAHCLHMVLDFQDVKLLSSEGFRPLLRLNRQVRERNGRLILCNLTPEVRDIFAVTLLISTTKAAPATFEVQPDVPAAVGSLYQPSSDHRAGNDAPSS